MECLEVALADASTRLGCSGIRKLRDLGHLRQTTIEKKLLAAGSQLSEKKVVSLYLFWLSDQLCRLGGADRTRVVAACCRFLQRQNIPPHMVDVAWTEYSTRTLLEFSAPQERKQHLKRQLRAVAEVIRQVIPRPKNEPVIPDEEARKKPPEGSIKQTIPTTQEQASVTSFRTIASSTVNAYPASTWYHDVQGNSDIETQNKRVVAFPETTRHGTSANSPGPKKSSANPPLPPTGLDHCSASHSEQIEAESSFYWQLEGSQPKATRHGPEMMFSTHQEQRHITLRSGKQIELPAHDVKGTSMQNPRKRTHQQFAMQAEYAERPDHPGQWSYAYETDANNRHMHPDRLQISARREPQINRPSQPRMLTAPSLPPIPVARSVMSASHMMPRFEVRLY